VQGTGQGPLEITPVAKDVFVADSVGAEITFERDAKGKVIALTLKQAGQVLRGERH
jgi:serine-type D-Ala-D-Ala carboxypeptidase/endopeptidase